MWRGTEGRGARPPGGPAWQGLSRLPLSNQVLKPAGRASQTGASGPVGPGESQS